MILSLLVAAPAALAPLQDATEPVRFERTAFAWGIQQPDLLQRTFWMGIDGLFSDFPDRMMDAYRVTLGRPPDIV